MANATNKISAKTSTAATTNNPVIKAALDKHHAKGNSETIKGATEAATTQAGNSETIKVATKADKGRAILGECYGMKQVPARKDIIARLVKEADLTPAGAATYLQNYKSKNGLTQKALAEKAGAATA